MRQGSAVDAPLRALWLVHHHPGRLRLRASPFLRDGETAARVRQALEARAGVRRTEHNPRTGSVLVEYVPGQVDVESLLALVADEADLDEVVDTAERRALQPEPASRLVEALQQLDAFARRLTSERAGLWELVSGALTVTSVWSFVASKEQRLPRWDNALYWAYSVFRDGLRARAQGEPPPAREDRRAGANG